MKLIRAVRTTALALAPIVVGGAGSREARAEEALTCVSAYDKVQEHKEAGRFVEAREEAKACARPSCKDWMVAECTKWLEEIERRQPTVVLLAETPQGEPVDVVKVVDASGKTWAESLTGKAVAVDPGRYELTFTSRDGRTVTVTKLVAENQRGIEIKAVFPAPEAKTPPSTAPASTPAGPTPAPAHAPPADDAANPRRTTFRVVGTVAAAAGVGALVGGYLLTVSGASAFDDAVASECGPNARDPVTGQLAGPGTSTDVCTAEGLSARDRAASKKNLGVGLMLGGGALLASGIVLWAVAPSSTPSPAAGFAPRITKVQLAGSGLTLGGVF